MSPRSHDRNIRGRTLAVLAAVAVVTAGAVGSRQITGGGGGGGGSEVANLWVVPSNTSPATGTCVRASTPETFSAATSAGHLCSDNDDVDHAWNAAYQKASAGDTIRIMGGIYTVEQDITNRTNLAVGSAVVTMQMAAGETATIRDAALIVETHDILIHGGDTVNSGETDRIIVEGERGASTNTCPTAANNGDGCWGVWMKDASLDGQRNITIEDVQTRNLDIGSDNSIVRYSEVGPNTMSIRNPACEDLVETYDEPVAGIQFIRNDIHTDDTVDGFTACNGAHLDGADMRGTNNVWDGNRFWWCTQCVFYGESDSTGTVFQNNMIEETNACASGCDAPQEVSLPGGGTIRYNTMEGTLTTGGTAVVYGNVFLGNNQPVQCSGGGMTFTNNTFTDGSGTCNGAKVCSPKLAATGATWGTGNGSDIANADFRLASDDTCARNYGTGTPVLIDHDWTFESRPQGTQDAGADEIP
jgi:hypothetical protein